MFLISPQPLLYPSTQLQWDLLRPGDVCCRSACQPASVNELLTYGVRRSKCQNFEFQFSAVLICSQGCHHSVFLRFDPEHNILNGSELHHAEVTIDGIWVDRYQSVMGENEPYYTVGELTL